jgi:hypothetical protein
LSVASVHLQRAAIAGPHRSVLTPSDPLQGRARADMIAACATFEKCVSRSPASARNTSAEQELRKPTVYAQRLVVCETSPRFSFLKVGELMMAELAVRLSFDNVDQLLVDRIVDGLRSAGFQVLASSMRGIDARAQREVIQEFFEVPVSDTAQPQFAREPKFERLPKGPHYRAYFPRPPQLF